jgi:hypothetical protein
MSSVAVTINGVLWDKQMKMGRPVVLWGEAYLTDLTVGGGPVVPPDQPPVTGGPPGAPIHPIWGPPGFNPPGPGMPPGIGGGPIVPPLDWTPPPGVTVPPPGSPPVVIGGAHPVNPVVVPPFIIVSYPGVGPVIVPSPVTG